MLEKYKEELPLFYEQINKVISSGKINHAYLLETKNYDDVKTLVLDISKQLITCKANLSDVKIQKIYQQIDNGTFNDFYFIERDGAYIKKEQLLKLQDEFKNKSINNGIRLYVIYEADKLNKASANTILKFLEEPNDNIIALLVTKNRYQVLSTILSRCQLLTITDSLSSQSKKDDPIKIEVVISFLLNLSIKQKKIIGYLNNEWIALSKTKDDLFESLTIMQNILLNLLYFKETGDKKFMIYGEDGLRLVQKMTINDIINKLSIINNQIPELKYNVNLKLWCDKFLLSITK